MGAIILRGARLYVPKNGLKFSDIKQRFWEINELRLTEKELTTGILRFSVIPAAVQPDFVVGVSNR